MKVLNASQIVSAAEAAIPLVVEDPLRAPRGGIVLMHGAPNTGKSFLAQTVAHRVAGRGERVMMILGETSVSALRQRLLGIQAHAAMRDDVLAAIDVVLDPPVFTDAEAMRPIIDLAESTEPALVVIDPLSVVLAGDENSSAEITALMRLLSVFPRNGVAVLIVHHDRKAQKGVASDIRGSSAMRAAADEVYSVSENGEYIRIRNTKSRDFARLDDKRARIVTNAAGPAIDITLAGDPARPDEDLTNAVMAALSDGPLTTTELRAKLAAPARKIDAAIHTLVMAARIVGSPRTAPGKRGRPGREYRLA